MPINVRLPARLELCFNCRHTWTPVKSPVVRCPRCKNRYWFLPQRPKRGRPPKQKQKENDD